MKDLNAIQNFGAMNILCTDKTGTLTLVTEGVIEYHVNGSVFILKEGQALFGNANSLHSGNMVEGQDCHYISITFDPRLVYGYENSLIYEKYVMPVVLDGALCGVGRGILDLLGSEVYPVGMGLSLGCYTGLGT